MRELFTSLVAWRLPAVLLRLTVLVLGGLGLLVYLNYPTLQKYFHARDRRDQYRESVQSLKAENERLMQEQAALRDGGFDKEKAIRERLLMIRPGEKVLFIEDPDQPAETPVP